MSEEEDLGIKIVSKDESFWTNALERAKEAVFNAKKEIEINENILTLAEGKVREEQEKTKEK